MEKVTQIVLEFFRMVWDIYWGLAFGFMLSSVIRAFVSTESITARLGKNNLTATGLSSFFGAVSSSCSYAAASMSRTLLLKGATWSNAITFMVASTNLVFEIFIVIVSLLGWPFFLGEVIGGVFFIVITSLLIAQFLPLRLKKESKINMQDKDHSDIHQHQHHTDVHNMEPNLRKSKWVAASRYFYMDVMMVGKDILLGLTFSAVLMVLVPGGFWKSIFLSNSGASSHAIVLAWNAFAGILIAVIAFVCSVGNIVMAAVLWHGGISFGGVIAFILADLITIPMLLVYRRYYGLKTMFTLLIALTISIFLSSLFVDLSFAALHWLPPNNLGIKAHMGHNFKWDWQGWLNILFVPLSIVFFAAGKRSIK